MERHFVSYPKSGRTWIRYALSGLDVAGSVQFHHDGFEFNDGSRPAHDFDLTSRLERYSHVDRLVYLERDPRDVMLSLYMQVTGRFRDFFHYEGSVSDFIRDGYFGAPHLQRFREMWAQIARRNGFLTERYEACHQDMEGVISRILDYYGFRVEGARVAEAVRNASFDRMKAVERSGTFEEPWLQLRNGSPKVRQGKVGSYRDTLSDDDIAYLNDVFGIDDKVTP